MAQSSPESPPARSGMMPENVFIVACAALMVGLLLGQAVGRRQGLQVNQVVLPEGLAQEAEAAAHAEAGEIDDATEAEMKATAPKPPESVAEARAMVSKMGMADADMLIDLGKRKLGNHVNFLSIGFFEKATELEPERAEAWALLGEAYAAVHLPDEAAKAFAKYLALAPDGEYAEEARKATGQ